MAQPATDRPEGWKRPELPKRQRPIGLPLGAFLMVLGLGMGLGSMSTLIAGSAGPMDLAVLYLSAPAALLGIWTFSISAIVLEIRRSAFEAARRAGETGPEEGPAVPL